MRRRLVILVGCLAAVLLSQACSVGPQPGAGGWTQRGVASWYGPGFHGKTTANGETYDMDAMTAAHKELPFGTIVEVKNLDNGKTARVRINDRGPFVGGRIIDLSRAAARKLGVIGPGTARVALSARIEPAAGTGGAYTVQAGAYRDRDKALDLAERLRRSYRVDIPTHDGWHRVRVGGRRSRSAAEKLANELRRKGFDALVVSAS